MQTLGDGSQFFHVRSNNMRRARGCLHVGDAQRLERLQRLGCDEGSEQQAREDLLALSPHLVPMDEGVQCHKLGSIRLTPPLDVSGALYHRSELLFVQTCRHWV